MTMAILKEGYTFFSLILGICGVILPKFMITMCEFTLLLVGAITKFSEFFAKL